MVRLNVLHAPSRGATLLRDLDTDSLFRRLRRHIRGEVRFDDGSRALYATDGSNYRQVPIGVVVPRDKHDVLVAVEACGDFNAPLLSRGGGTSLAGQCCNTAVILDFSKFMNRVIEIDAPRKLARVQPGCTCDDLRHAAEQHGLTFGPDPATHAWCTLGGMIGNNSCGVHSQMAGRTSDNVNRLDVLTYDSTRMVIGKTDDAAYERTVRAGGRPAEIFRRLRDLRDRYAKLIRERFPRIPRRVSGYNLDALLPEEGFHIGRSVVGSESTCVVVLEAELNLMHNPPARSLLVLGYEDVFHAADHIHEVAEFHPIGLEGLDRKFIKDLDKKHLQHENIALMPEGGGFLLVEFGGQTKDDSDDQARKLMEHLKRQPNAPTMKLFDDPAEEHRVWHVRESGLGATAHIPGEKENWEGWEDAAVPPDKVGPYLRDFRDLLNRFGYVGALYGHFGNGCVHTRLDFDLKSAEGVKKYRDFISAAADLVVQYGGSLSGEHGDGQSRAEMLPKMFGPQLIEAFNEFKSIWDPQWKMNPGKLVKPYRIDENLRYGSHYDPPHHTTQFGYAGDDHQFSRSLERCVGVGKCRRHDGGVMCPSYQVTREEMHSTRGRARLLWEALNGGHLEHQGWQSEAVKQALDLCLACKGCKGECPVHVDMATYKAEFLSHYWKGRLRPRHAYAFGWIGMLARFGGMFPGLANLLTQTPGLRAIAKAMAGMDQRRRIPAFAPQTFIDWFHQRGPRNAGGPPVMLWADTFNNYFHVPTAQAAVHVLEAAGFHVLVPQRHFCCGRPLYDYGFLDMARRWLLTILRQFKREIQAGVPFVVLEPSCAAVFRDELTNILPDELDAHRLQKQTMVLSEFLRKHAPHFKLPRLQRKALVHAHCHHRNVIGFDLEDKLLHDIGLDVHVPECGCCGMAGAFGFEAGEHHDLSIACGERKLLPAVREAGDDTLIIADGFSCREQIAQTTHRRALHLAEVLDRALHHAPERSAQPAPHNRTLVAVGVTAAVLGLTAALWARRRRPASPRRTSPHRGSRNRSARAPAESRA